MWRPRGDQTWWIEGAEGKKTGSLVVKSDHCGLMDMRTECGQNMQNTSRKYSMTNRMQFTFTFLVNDLLVQMNFFCATFIKMHCLISFWPSLRMSTLPGVKLYPLSFWANHLCRKRHVTDDTTRTHTVSNLHWQSQQKGNV